MGWCWELGKNQEIRNKIQKAPRKNKRKKKTEFLEGEQIHKWGWRWSFPGTAPAQKQLHPDRAEQPSVYAAAWTALRKEELSTTALTRMIMQDRTMATMWRALLGLLSVALRKALTFLPCIRELAGLERNPWTCCCVFCLCLKIKQVEQLIFWSW